MIGRFFAILMTAFVTIAGPGSAQQADQDVVWVQIEAHPNLTVAQRRAGEFATQLADVNGFSLGGSWYGILLGPYLREDAQRVLRSYRRDRLIPQDSFIAFSRNLGAQYWPKGANVLNRGVVAAPNVVPQQQAIDNVPQTLVPADETPTEARRSERLLSAQERRGLQIALQASGFYNSTIDGAFGAGTRRSMSGWQLSNGFEPTGILTTSQRKTLMDQYNAPLLSVGMRRVRDTQAGIEIDIPEAVVSFTRNESPFAKYAASTDLGAQVFLISQPGTQATLSGLYNILQTLEIVPLDGPRELGRNRFVIEGRGNGVVSHTEAALEDGEIKGFTLIWPIGDDARRSRILAAMQDSFARIDGVLDPAAGDDSQSVDLVAGLAVRQPRLSRSGFFIDGNGTVVTTADAAENCTRITLDDDLRANVVASDLTLGVAVLRPDAQLAPMSVAQLRPSKGRLQSQVAVSGFSYAGILGAPTLTFGTVADIKGLAGEPELTRLALNALPGDAGGPVLDTQGGVLGMLLPISKTGRQLPKDVSFSADSEAILKVLEAAGVPAQNATDDAELAPVDMTRMAMGITVLVNCWN